MNQSSPRENRDLLDRFGGFDDQGFRVPHGDDTRPEQLSPVTCGLCGKQGSRDWLDYQHRCGLRMEGWKP